MFLSELVFLLGVNQTEQQVNTDDGGGGGPGVFPASLFSPYSSVFVSILLHHTRECVCMCA